MCLRVLLCRAVVRLVDRVGYWVVICCIAGFATDRGWTRGWEWATDNRSGCTGWWILGLGERAGDQILG